MKKTFLYLVVCLTLACSRPESITDRIYYKIDKLTIVNEKFPFSEFTPFDWDTMFYFKHNVPVEIVEKYLNAKYDYFEDKADRLVFKKGKSIVYREDKIYNPDDNLIIKFILPSDTNDVFLFSKNRAKIRLRKMQDGRDVYYRAYLTEE